MLARLLLVLCLVVAAQAAVWDRLFVIWFENNAFTKVLKDQFWFVMPRFCRASAQLFCAGRTLLRKDSY